MPFLEDFNKANTYISRFLNFINSLTNDGSELIEIETSNNPVLQLFDKYSGIDAVQITKDKQIRTVAMRVQYGKNWNTFTIRYRRSTGARTEYEKRLDAIKNNKLYPHLTIQCYLSANSKEILSVGIIKTVDLYQQLESGIGQIRVAKEDGNQFIFVNWRDLSNILVFVKDIGVFFNGKQVAY